jgi:hypothetical protein
MGIGVAGVLMVVLGNASGFGLSTAWGISGGVPVPVRAAEWGEPEALSTTETAAVSTAAEAGVKVTVIVQEEPAASEAPQLLVWPKLLALVPVTEMLVTVSGAVPGLESVMSSGAAAVLTSVAGKVSGFGLSKACGAIPVPLNAAVCGEPVALSAMDSVALRLPAEAGVNVTVMVQLAPAATELPQLLVWLKLLALAPVMVMPVIVRAAVPGFDSVVDSVPAEVPTSVLANVSVLEVRVALGAVPVPVSAAVCGEPDALSTTEIAALRLPVAAGVKVTVIMHALSSGRLAGQLLVCEKLLALVPVIEMLVIARAAFPGLARVIVMVAEDAPTMVPGKARGLGLSTACGAGAVAPVPVSVTVCGEPDALSATVSVAEKLVAEAGVKLT